MRSVGSAASRVGGVVLVAAGVYVAWYGAWELRVFHAGAGPDRVVNAAGDVQRRLADVVATAGLAGLAVALATLLAAAGIWRTIRARRSSGLDAVEDPAPGASIAADSAGSRSGR